MFAGAFKDSTDVTGSCGFVEVETWNFELLVPTESHFVLNFTNGMEFDTISMHFSLSSASNLEDSSALSRSSSLLMAVEARNSRSSLADAETFASSPA